jgi:hypothetical protein
MPHSSPPVIPHGQLEVCECHGDEGCDDDEDDEDDEQNRVDGADLQGWEASTQGAGLKGVQAPRPGDCALPWHAALSLPGPGISGEQEHGRPCLRVGGREQV